MACVCGFFCQATFAASALSAPNRRLKMHEILPSLCGFQQPSQPSQSPPSPPSLSLFLPPTSLPKPASSPYSCPLKSGFAACLLEKCTNFIYHSVAFYLFAAVAAVSHLPKLLKCTNFCRPRVCRRRLPVSRKCRNFIWYCACRFSRLILSVFQSLSVTQSLCLSVSLSLCQSAAVSSAALFTYNVNKPTQI